MRGGDNLVVKTAVVSLGGYGQVAVPEAIIGIHVVGQQVMQELPGRSTQQGNQQQQCRPERSYRFVLLQVFVFAKLMVP